MTDPKAMDPKVKALIIRGARIGLKALTRAFDSVIEDGGDVIEGVTKAVAEEVGTRVKKARARAKVIADELKQDRPIDLTDDAEEED